MRAAWLPTWIFLGLASSVTGMRLLADDDGLAWVTGACSVVLAAGSAAFYRYLR